MSASTPSPKCMLTARESCCHGTGMTSTSCLQLSPLCLGMMHTLPYDLSWLPFMGLNYSGKCTQKITTWGEGQVGCINDHLRLTCKGTVLHHGEVLDECHKWVDVASTNAKLVWRSFCPTLLHKCLWYATNGGDIWCNVASVIVSLVHKRYPIDWWRPTLLRWLVKILLPSAVHLKERLSVS